MKNSPSKVATKVLPFDKDSKSDGPLVDEPPLLLENFIDKKFE